MYVVADEGENCLWFVEAGNGTVVRQVGSEGSGEGQFICPHYMYHHHVREGECHIYVSDRDNHCISVYTASGDYIRRFGSRGSGLGWLFYPHGVCVDSSGRAVVCDTGNNIVVRYGWEGDVEQWEQLEEEIAYSIEITPDGFLIVGTEDGSLICYNY